MLNKNYDSASIELKIAEKWEEKGAFKAGAGAKSGADPFCIMIPPPNVTGSLHMGHALNNTIQDILVRFSRMRGYDSLWQVGMDHAGIATQMVVERQLAAQKEPNRWEMGREKFVERVWQWRKESGGAIAHQLRRLGVSCDWSRERFTMDEGLSAAVLEVFVSLYDEGLIYKDKRLVNWDPKLQTAISDLEVEQKETAGFLWHINYPLEGKSYDKADPSTYITIATTRPETLLGDVAIAVHPEDPRYKDLIGSYAILPFVGRKLLIVGDDYADPEMGSGAVKITPAHDFNDFEVGRRHNLKAINILGKAGELHLEDNPDFLEDLPIDKCLEGFIKDFSRLDRFAAREKLVALLEKEGYLASVEEHVHMVPYGDRGNVPIEPFLTDQWYVNAKALAGPAIEAVKSGKTKFYPKNWEKTYFDWMENIQPWCISRQLWWGHRIPAWYGPDGHVFVKKTEEEAYEAANAHYGKSVVLTRDEDVLDTWFSSALWPFSTLGWPEQTPELSRYYPTQMLVTGFDIIFFWVARMMMFGLHFMKEVPFTDVYVHALVRDKSGAKMSKSKGNVIDPLDLIESYGADALRFTLAIMAAQGRDVKLDPARIIGYRNFATKLWNASRFAQMNGVDFSCDFSPKDAKYIINRWLLAELSNSIEKVTHFIEAYRFNEAAEVLYRFIWHSLCDWYIELVKPILFGEDEEEKLEVQGCLAYCLREVYKLLHPFMPYITEELWAETGAGKNSVLSLTEWPTLSYEDAEALEDIKWLINIVTEVRSVRVEMQVPAAAFADIIVLEADSKVKERISAYSPILKRLARIEDIGFSLTVPEKSAQIVVGETTFCMPLADLIDFDKERQRLQKEIGKLEQNIEKIAMKLRNEKYLANVDPSMVAADRDKVAELEAAKEKVVLALQRL